MSPDEYAAAQLAAESVYTLNCEQTGQALRNMSNRLLDRASWATHQGHCENGRRPVNEGAGVWQQRMRNPAFWNKVWEYMAEAFKSCDLNCFDDGVAVGQISGVGYCQASVGVGGLNAPGFLSQPPLPVCQTEVYVGCQQGYREAAQDFNGCQQFTQGQFQQVFDESISQDCHVQAP
jgi:hypothetical protein